MIVKLFGELGEKFGQNHKFAIHRPSDAVRLLDLNHADFKEYFGQRWYKILRYNPRTLQSSAIPIHELGIGCSQHEIHIVPTLQGAKDGEDKALFGVTLLAAAIIFSGGAAAFGKAAMAAATGKGVSWQMYMALAGVGFTAVGIADMLAPPKRDKDSNLIDGDINAVEQGVAIPLVYGRFRTGSIVASSGITIDQLKRYSQWRPFNTIEERNDYFNGVDTDGPPV